MTATELSNDYRKMVLNTTTQVQEATNRFVQTTAYIDKYAVYHAKLVSRMKRLKKFILSDQRVKVETDLKLLEGNFKRMNDIHDDIESNLALITIHMENTNLLTQEKSFKEIITILKRVDNDFKLSMNAIKLAIEDYNKVVEKYYLDCEKQ